MAIDLQKDAASISAEKASENSAKRRRLVRCSVERRDFNNAFMLTFRFEGGGAEWVDIYEDATPGEIADKLLNLASRIERLG